MLNIFAGNIVSKLAYLSDIFGFSTLNRRVHGNDADIIAVTDKVKAVTAKLGLWVRKLEGKILDMFSGSKDFVTKNGVEASDTGIDQCIIKVHLVNLHSRCSKYFPEE